MNEETEKVEEPMEEESFADLLRDSIIKPLRFTPGQKIDAKIASISGELIFLDLGGKSEGYLDTKEFLDEQGQLTVKAGDTIQAYFLSSSENELRFTTRVTGGEAGKHFMEEAWQSGIPVDGVVEKEIKGGFEIRIAGGLRGFCPFSQMGMQRQSSPKELIGQHLPFRITQFGEKGRNIVLSNRSVLEEERQKQREELKSSLTEGMKVKGTISSIQGFGAFVKVGGVEGLIPISEIGWDRVEEVGDLLAVGQEVEVMVMKLDWEKDRFSFSIKRALPDPWENIHVKFPQGSSHSGKVVRLTNFGAFVTLAGGVDGLLHISKLGAGKRINHPREAVSTGQVIEVKVEAVDSENKRLSLSLAQSDAQDEVETNRDYMRQLKETPRSMGTFADLLRAKAADKNKK